MNSIQSRLGFSAAAILVLFLSATGMFVERSYRASVIAGVEDQLRPVIYALMGAAQERDGVLNYADGLFQPRLQQPDSGLYARVTGGAGSELWRSPSLALADENNGQPGLLGQIMVLDAQAQELAVGSLLFQQSENTTGLFCLRTRVDWEGLADPRVTFTVCAEQAPYRQLITEFRYGLYVGFGALMLLLSLAAVLALRWGLRPLRQIQHQLKQMQRGSRGKLDAVQPKELTPLVASLNRYVAHQASLREGHRRALDDMAHSLKTPLSVLRVGVHDTAPDLPLLQEQVTRMQGVLDHQLARIARVTQIDGVSEQPWIAVDDVLAQLARALRVAYPEHRIDVESGSQRGQADWKLRMHEDDLLDVLGNVMENACKYGAGHIRVSLVEERGTLVVTVEDNGSGIDPHYFPQLLRRGMRLDTQAQGQGIGLAMVSELLAVYGGAVELASSALGGAKIRLLFAAALKEHAEAN